MIQLPELEAQFPGLCGTNYDVVSPQTPNYNCIAWAAFDDHRWWWPDAFGLYFWPQGIQRASTVDAFVAAFVGLGYELCANADHEDGFERVAIFVSADGSVSHMARERPDGTWTSKLGNSYDIIHIALTDIQGQKYGVFHCALRKQLAPPAVI